MPRPRQPWHVAVAAACWTLASCSQQAAVSEGTNVELVGLLRAQLLSCAGRPAAVYQLGDREVMRYSLRSQGSLSGTERCDATITLRHDLVESVDFAGTGSGAITSSALCERVFGNCQK